MTQNKEDPTKTGAVAEVLSLQERMADAALRGEGEAFAEFLSMDFVAMDPSNAIRHRDDLIALFSSRQVAYTSVGTTIDYAAQLGPDLVVVMGMESTTQTSVPPGTSIAAAATRGTLRRRFTNLFRREDGVWRLLVKQSTVVSLD